MWTRRALPSSLGSFLLSTYVCSVSGMDSAGWSSRQVAAQRLIRGSHESAEALTLTCRTIPSSVSFPTTGRSLEILDWWTSASRALLALLGPIHRSYAFCLCEKLGSRISSSSF